jgi:hypothetical protein
VDFIQIAYGNDLVRVIQTLTGPQLYLKGFRVHHWMPGIALGGLALLGAVLDDNRENKKKYAALGLVGVLLLLDDLPDFIAFLPEKER